MEGMIQRFEGNRAVDVVPDVPVDVAADLVVDVSGFGLPAPCLGGVSSVDVEDHRHCHWVSTGRWNRWSRLSALTTINTLASVADVSRMLKLCIAGLSQSCSIGVVPSVSCHCTRLDCLSRPSCVRRVKKSS